MATISQWTPEHFGKALDRLTEMIVLGKAHIRIARGLGRSVGDDPAIAHVSRTFWGMTMTAHLDVAQLLAFKLHDERSGTMTVEFLLQRAEDLRGQFRKASPQAVDGIVHQGRCFINSMAAPLKKIRAKRNRVIAHSDPTIIFDPAKLTKAVELSYSDLDVVFTVTGRILNRLSGAFRDSSADFDMLGVDDYENAIDLIRDAKCAQIREYEAEFGPWDHLRPKNCK